MKLKNKLALQFTLIVGIIITIAFVITYFLFANFREESFYQRLEFRATLSAHRFLNTENINQNIFSQQNDQLALSYLVEKIYSKNDSLLMSNSNADELQIDKFILNNIKQNQIISFRKNEFECLGIYMEKNNKGIISIVGAIDLNGNKKLNYLLRIEILVFLFSIIVTYFAGRFFAVRALMPINKIINQLEVITVGQLASRLETNNNKDEISKLINAFNEMLERIENSIEAQSKFIANASHELRNPLSSITGQLEVALIKDREMENYKEIISSVLEDVKNLNRIANQLLLLARTSEIENMLKLEPIRIDELILETEEEFIKQVEGFNIEIIISNAIQLEKQLIILANPSLIKTAVNNLLENAYKYSTEKYLKIYINTNGNLLSITFENRSDGIPKEELDEIFLPFFRGKNSKKNKGDGLGLSLVKNIMLLHGGSIEAHSVIKGKTEFIMYFNLID